jgi:hypothetical protein
VPPSTNSHARRWALIAVTLMFSQWAAATSVLPFRFCAQVDFEDQSAELTDSARVALARLLLRMKALEYPDFTFVARELAPPSMSEQVLNTRRFDAVKLFLDDAGVTMSDLYTYYVRADAVAADCIGGGMINANSIVIRVMGRRCRPGHAAICRDDP